MANTGTKELKKVKKASLVWRRVLCVFHSQNGETNSTGGKLTGEQASSCRGEDTTVFEGVADSTVSEGARRLAVDRRRLSNLPSFFLSGAPKTAAAHTGKPTEKLREGLCSFGGGGWAE